MKSLCKAYSQGRICNIFEEAKSPHPMSFQGYFLMKYGVQRTEYGTAMGCIMNFQAYSVVKTLALMCIIVKLRDVGPPKCIENSFLGDRPSIRSH